MEPVNEVFLCSLLHVNSTGEVRERRHIAFPGSYEWGVEGGGRPVCQEPGRILGCVCVESPLQVSWELVSMR